VQPADYTSTSGTLSFAPGDTEETVSVTVNGDTEDEGAAEQFFLNFSGVENGQLPDTQAVGTITDDDGEPTIIIADTTVAEGDSGSSTATFTVTLSAASGLPITVNYATADDTAVQPADYITTSAAPSPLPPVETRKTIYRHHQRRHDRRRGIRAVLPQFALREVVNGQPRRHAGRGHDHR
jgi:hypothetical protein